MRDTVTGLLQYGRSEPQYTLPGKGTAPLPNVARCTWPGALEVGPASPGSDHPFAAPSPPISPLRCPWREPALLMPSRTTQLLIWPNPDGPANEISKPPS